MTMAKERKARDDRLPEIHVYYDTGCRVSPSCFTCPLPECIYVTPLPDQEAKERRQRIVEMRRSGLKRYVWRAR